MNYRVIITSSLFIWVWQLCSIGHLLNIEFCTGQNQGVISNCNDYYLHFKIPLSSLNSIIHSKYKSFSFECLVLPYDIIFQSNSCVASSANQESYCVHIVSTFVKKKINTYITSKLKKDILNLSLKHYLGILVINQKSKAKFFFFFFNLIEKKII